MREGELLGLRWEDVDFKNGFLSVRRALAKGGLHPTFQEYSKTNSSNRRIRLMPVALAELKMLKDRQKVERKAWKGSYRDYGLVFTVKGGGPILARNMARQFKSILSRAKLSETIRVHDLRHTMATSLLRMNVPTKVVSEMLGHSSIRVTAAYTLTFCRTCKKPQSPFLSRHFLSQTKQMGISLVILKVIPKAIPKTKVPRKLIPRNPD